MIVEDCSTRLKWCGSATILLEHGATQLLFDPFFPLNGKVFQPPMDELSGPAHILVTHGHFDHISSIPAILGQGCGSPTVYCTESPGRALVSMGADEACIMAISPGGVICIDPFVVRVHKGRHVVFDAWMVIRTLLSPRVPANWGNFVHIARMSRKFKEAGETVVFEINSPDKSVLLMGSLNLDDATDYPVGADLLVLPLQGRSDLAAYAMPFIERLQPCKVLLFHYDDTFPPFTSAVDTGLFVSLMRQRFPDVPVICRPASAEWIEI